MGVAGHPTSLIDSALVLYLGLFVLFLWRQLCAWKCCGKWLEYANYCSLLLALVFVIFCYDAYYFYMTTTTTDGKATWESMPGWLRPWVLVAPGICLLTFVGSAVQTWQHVEQIRNESAVDRHDKAVQIIMLPAVYSVMGMGALTRVYTFLGSESDPYAPANQEDLHRALARGETCFWVGDLYESWALYQFGLLTLDVLKSNFKFESQCGKTESERAAALALLGATPAVESLVWLGILSFVVCCVAQAGWALWLLTFDSHETSREFDDSMSQFTMAGFLASCSAIYNVFIVETSYSRYLDSFYPIWKFFTVKILVTFAWVQKTVFKVLMNVNTMLPPHAKKFCDGIPILGQIMSFPKAQFELFYGCLIMTECLLVCICHYWAWNSSEEWYDTAALPEDDEKGNHSPGRSHGNPFDSAQLPFGAPPEPSAPRSNYGAFRNP